MIEIDTKDLKIGMYVTQLDRPWTETSYLFQGFRLENNKQIEKLQALCKTVKIDEEQSSAATSSEPSSLLAAKPKVVTQDSLHHKVTEEHKKRFKEEMAAAHHVYHHTSLTVNKALNNFRLKDYIAIPEIKASVDAVIGNVMHNANALLLLRNMRSKQQDTATHSLNVCIFAVLFGHYLGFTHEQLKQLGMAAVFHDVGKTKLPDGLFEKNNSNLTAEEALQMKMHTLHGAEMLRNIEKMPREVIEVAHSHHERIDGKGYPRNLKGSEISFFSRIIAIINVYERLTNNTDSSVLLSCPDALKSIYAMRETLFDGELVESFIKCLGVYPVGSVVELSNHAIGVVIAVKPDKHLLPTVMVLRDGHGEITHPPQIINLDKFHNQEGPFGLFIKRAVNPGAVDADLSKHLVKELGISLN